MTKRNRLSPPSVYGIKSRTIRVVCDNSGKNKGRKSKMKTIIRVITNLMWKVESLIIKTRVRWEYRWLRDENQDWYGEPF